MSKNQVREKVLENETTMKIVPELNLPTYHYQALDLGHGSLNSQRNDEQPRKLEALSNFSINT